MSHSQGMKGGKYKMTKQEFLQVIQSRVIILDGATGSNLQEEGMPSGVCPEEWILNNKEKLIHLQMEFLEAGTDILYAPTFTSNRIKLEEYGLAYKLEQINSELVELSHIAIKQYYERQKESDFIRKIWIAGDLTMTGQQLYPIGTMQFEELVDIYKQQVKAILKAKVDLFVVETMMSLQECRAAILAIKESCDLPIMVTMTFQEDNKTLYGTNPETAAIVLQAMGVDAVGVNCSTGPEKMADIIREMKQYTKVPIIAKPNAGMPKLVDGKTYYDMQPETFAKEVKELIKLGVNLVGGCCGTTKEHIKQVASYAKQFSGYKLNEKTIRAITTERQTLHINLDGQFLVVGERINPTGKKQLQEELKAGNFDLVLTMAEEQIANGAKILDVNMGMNGILEKETMVQAIYELINMSDIPLCIDSSHVDVLEAALRIYPGRALINSVSLETEKIEKLLPLVKKYGAMFVLLPVSDLGLPKSFEEKKENILTVMERAKRIGLGKEDLIVDALVNTIGADQNASVEVMKTIRYCKEELGIATICGLSNISFGLPYREYVNSTFLAFAIKEGLTMAIANPSQELLMNIGYASDLLMNKENANIRYIEEVSKRDNPITNHLNQVQKEQQESVIYEAIIKGNKKSILGFVEETVRRGVSASTILNEMLIPAINEVGRLFDQQIYFLPQLIGSAETMKKAVEFLEPMLQKDGKQEKLATIVMATVEGDIHDIGKNLVVLMLKNYGYHVIDLGKDVKAKDIIQKAKEEDAEIIGLSALMTTTMMEMKHVIALAKKENIKSKIIIGGAVITQSFADEIGADGYSKDAQEAVKLVKRLLA